MPKYITAKGLELTLSGAASNWVANSSAKETQLGSSRNDVFHGSGGDTLIGGAGDDTYYLWDSASVVVEKAGEGVDTVDARFWGPATLAANVENLLLNSPGSTAGTGNALNNIIVAGAVGATLNGLAGDDVLVGGAGADLFKVAAGNGSDAIMNFKPGSDVIQLGGYGVSTFAQLQAVATQSGADVKLGFANGETLVIRDVALSSLTAYDFGLKADPVAIPAGYSQLTGPGAAWTAHGWYVLNNVWNPGDLVYKTDYVIDSAYSASDMTAKTTFNWSFPVVTEPYPTIRAYPEVIFGPAPMSGGHKASDIGGVFPVQVSTLSQLTADYDVSYKGNTSGFNVSFDIWLTDTPNGGADTITSEVMVWVHKGGFDPTGEVVGTYSNGSVTGKIYASKAGDWTYTAVVLDADTPKGQIDIASILKTLEGLKLVSSADYVASVELGAEVVSGAGSLTINNLDLDVRAHNTDGSTKVMHVEGSGTTTTTILASPDPVATPEKALDLSGDDTFTYDRAVAAISGGAGHDTLVLKASATVNLGDAVNQVAGGTAVVTGFEDVDASAASGAVVLTGSAADNRLIGGAYADVLTGGGGADILSGGAGADSLDGGTGSDQQRGEAGDDRIVYDAADTVIDGGAGRDTLVLNTAATVNLGNFSTTQISGGSAYVAGFEDVDASAANGAVVLNGSQFNNTLTGGAFADTLMGGAGFDILKGGLGNDFLDGGADADQVRGEAGDDRIVYDAADTVIDGGAGRDTLVLKAAAVVHLENFSSSQVTGGSAYVLGFEDVDATNAAGGVTVTGSQFNNTLTGGAFADTLRGGAGFDVLKGGLGNDFLDGGADADQLRGEAGDDRIVYDAADTVIDGGAGRDTLVLNTAATVNLSAFSSSQVVGGTAYVSGFEDVDASGATAAVRLNGSAFNNTLIGGSGADTLAGGAGFDTLTGGAGSDLFVFGAFNPGDVDKITDFSHAQGDRIDLSAIDAVVGGLDDPFAFIGQSAFHHVAGEVRYGAAAGGLMVQADVNGDGLADFSILVANTTSLVHGDFIL
ncbi:GH12 family glycosyl hydrolase domain-containing protein [Caulobacter sp. LjRoot300]|uniref:GH12 family glycosyl hydrolase domain-containing protein n=1 Tax=Caulobacter sp. LjRoot300 TaxID=3342321 RepID=UPI003ECC9B49